MWKYTTNAVVIVGCIPLLESGDNKYSSPPGNFSSGLNSHFEKPATNSCYFNWALANTNENKQNFNWALADTNKPPKIQISHVLVLPTYSPPRLVVHRMEELIVELLLVEKVWCQKLSWSFVYLLCSGMIGFGLRRNLRTPGKEHSSPTLPSPKVREVLALNISVSERNCLLAVQMM